MLGQIYIDINMGPLMIDNIWAQSELIGVKDLPLGDMLSLGAWRMGLGYAWMLWGSSSVFAAAVVALA